jgi:hypothetical protein
VLRHDTPFERVIKIRDGAVARPALSPDVSLRLCRLMCGKALPFRESWFLIQRGYASDSGHSPRNSWKHVPEGHRPSAHQAAKPHPGIEPLLTRGLLRSGRACFVRGHSSIIFGMTEKEMVLKTVRELPDDCSIDEIADRIEFLAAA